MSWMLNPWVLWLRRVMRHTGVNRFPMRRVGVQDYEKKVVQRYRGCLRAGDVVWDVGANGGFYSIMAARENAKIKVFAFEPSPTNRRRLEANVRDLPNITILPYALSATDSQVILSQSDDPEGVTSTIVSRKGTANIEVTARRGDSIVERGEVPPPNVIKVDVEGAEADVLRGLLQTARRPTLRSVIVEVHFSILESTGQLSVMRSALKEFEREGFVVRWLDRSHAWLERGRTR